MALVSSNKLAGDVLFIGVGLGGCRLTNSLQKLGYECYYINTATGDFDNLEDVDTNMTYPIPKSKGCDKNMELAFNFASDYISDIHNKIDSSYRKYTHIVFLFSLGGGTGAGIAPSLAQFFASQYGDSKSVSLFGILPEKLDNAKSAQNALTCLKYIEENCDGVKSKILLDNSQADKFEINERFAEQIDNLLSLPELQVDKVQANMKSADERETLSLLSTEGYIYIARIDAPTGKHGDNEPYVIEGIEYIPEPEIRDCKEIAVSLSVDNIHDFNPEHLFKCFGRPLSDVKAGINDSETSYAYIFGTSLPQSVVDKLDKWLDEFEEEKKSIENKKVTFGNKERALFKKEDPKKSSSNPFAKTTTTLSSNPFAGKDALPLNNPFTKK